MKISAFSRTINRVEEEGRKKGIRNVRFDGTHMFWKDVPTLEVVDVGSCGTGCRRQAGIRNDKLATDAYAIWYV